MIKHLKIKNFKSHADTSLDLSYLNVITGLNGVGKTSIFQALLLLRQSEKKNRLAEGLDLNKPLCEIGQGKDAIYQYAEDDLIEFTIQRENKESRSWKFEVSDRFLDDTFIPVFQGESYPAKLTEIDKSILFSNYFQYLSAFRWSPRMSYPKDTYAVEQERQISLEKGQGELVAHFLHHYQSEKVLFENLIHPNAIDRSLLAQTSAWTNEISHNINIFIEDQGTNFQLNYNYNLQGGEFPTNKFQAENVGFGITYTLPVIVAILSSRPGSILFLENPEAHLHPYGQSKIAELIALAAQNNIQIFVETHSDHIINGILVAIRKYHFEGSGIVGDKVRIYYLDRDESQHATRSTRINLSENGKIKHPPEGFFDQASRDREYLMGF